MKDNIIPPNINADVHSAFIEVLNLISAKVSEIMMKHPALDQTDKNRWVIAARIFNMAYLHFWTPIFPAVVKQSIKDGDLFYSSELKE